MKSTDLKELLIRSLDKENDPEKAAGNIEEIGVTYRFNDGFSDRVLDRLFSAGNTVVREIEFVRNLYSVFYRIALTGVAAIVVLLISNFIVQGSLSFDSFLGLGNGYDESILCLLTGN
jgi:hypothetical protein